MYGGAWIAVEKGVRVVARKAFAQDVHICRRTWWNEGPEEELLVKLGLQRKGPGSLGG